ncbi:MAG TPA: hypothetical protein ENK39_09050 [Epsilonproteobacteria bacterium]|nr:hypothetical protein [Campylobacterota bacterium]
MKKVAVVKGSEVKIQTFNLEDFIQDKESRATIITITKKELKKLADSLGLDYADKDIVLSKKLLNAYLSKR